jgi:FMN reductase
MTHIVAIAGSPSDKSKSTELVRKVLHHLEETGFTTKLLTVRDFSPQELIYGVGQDSQSLKQVTGHIDRASAVIIATPIYKASYSGALKAFLDLLPQKSLAGKVVLPIATGGSQKHLLAIDYALKPVLYALGATHVLSGLYVSDDQVQRDSYGQLLLGQETELRLDDQLLALVSAVGVLATEEEY